MATEALNKDIAIVVRKAYVDDINRSITSREEAIKLKGDVPKFTEKYKFKIKGMVIL